MLLQAKCRGKDYCTWITVTTNNNGQILSKFSKDGGPACPQSEYFRISTAANNYVKVPELFMKMLSILYPVYIKCFFLFVSY
jgi:hypothetical protein